MMKNKIIGLTLAAVLLAGCQNTDSYVEAEQVVDEAESVKAMDAEKEEQILLTWDEKEVSIAGIERDYEIWFMADSHITLVNDNEPTEVREYAAQRAPGFVNEMGVSSDLIFSQFIDEANKQKPDMVLFGGDIIDFPSDANVAFLQSELDRLEVPYVFAMGNHDWTFPWEYMTPEGSEKYRPMLENYMYGNFTDEEGNSLTDQVLTVMGNTYLTMIELNDMMFLAIDDSSNQVALEALAGIEEAYDTGKPIILMQHVPFSTENLIAKAKESWGNPVTLGMQVHGGIAPNEISTDLWHKTHDDESPIKVVLAGHVHFPYEEALSDSTMQFITDAAFKGKVIKVSISQK